MNFMRRTCLRPRGSSDFNPADYLLWGELKDMIYAEDT